MLWGREALGWALREQTLIPAPGTLGCVRTEMETGDHY